MAEGDPVAIRCVRGPVIKEYEDGSAAIKIRLDPKEFQEFVKNFPMNVPCFLVREDPAAAQASMQKETIAASSPKPQRYGQAAKILRLSSFTLNPKVWAAFGTDEDYNEWVKMQRCAHCDTPPHWENDTFIYSDPAHVRRIADGAGTSIKPQYATIPLCHEDHLLQHQKGESALRGRNKEWFEKQRIDHVQRWLWEKIRDALGVESMAEIEPRRVMHFMASMGVAEYLPAEYISASAD